jgi:hypothetical protein
VTAFLVGVAVGIVIATVVAGVAMRREARRPWWRS